MCDRLDLTPLSSGRVGGGGRGGGRGEPSSFVFKALITVDDLSSCIFLFSNEEIVKHGASVEYGNFCRCNE